MKPLVPTLCLIAGIGLGWFAHPPDFKPVIAVPAVVSAPRTSADHSDHDTVAKTSTSGNSSAIRHADDPKVAGEKEKKEIEGLMEGSAKAMVDMQRAKFEARLAKLSVDLKLTAAQQERLRAVMEKRFAGLATVLNFGENPNPESAASMVDLTSSDGMDEAMADVLSDGQKPEYAAFKAKERQGRIASAALRNLASVTGALDLTPDQRDGVYQVLSEQAALVEDVRKPNALSSMAEELGAQDDELGLGGVAAMVEGDDGGPGEDNLSKKLKTRIESMVEAMRPYLTDIQIQQYRAHLETKAAAATVMFGGGAADEGDK